MTKTNKRNNILNNKKGEAYIDTAFKILIAVVIGALLFTSIYALFSDTILTELSQKVTALFSTGGTSINLGSSTQVMQPSFGGALPIELVA